MTLSIVFLRPCKCSQSESAASPYRKPRADEKAKAKEVEVKLSPPAYSPWTESISPDIFWALMHCCPRVCSLRNGRADGCQTLVLLQYEHTSWQTLKSACLWCENVCNYSRSPTLQHTWGKQGLALCCCFPYKREYLKRKMSGKWLSF